MNISVLFAEEKTPLEKVFPSNKGKVLDEFIYNLEWNNDWEVDFPPEGDWIPEGMELPIMEIMETKLSDIENEVPENLSDEQKLSNNLEIRVRFFVEGEFSLPITWKKKGSDETEHSSIYFQIESNNLSDEEAEAIPPFLFGDFLYLRLFLVILFSFCLIGVGAYIYKRWKEKPLEAIIESIPTTPKEEIFDKKIRTLLSGSEKISQKEFSYLITEWLKWRAGESSGKDFSGSTDSKLLDYLYKTTSQRKENILKWKNFLLYSKYTADDSTISKSEAEELLNDWKGLLP